MADRYTFTNEPSPFKGHRLLRWEKNGHPDPLNFWHVPPTITLATAKKRVRSGEMDG